MARLRFSKSFLEFEIRWIQASLRLQYLFLGFRSRLSVLVLQIVVMLGVVEFFGQLWLIYLYYCNTGIDVQSWSSLSFVKKCASLASSVKTAACVVQELQFDSNTDISRHKSQHISFPIQLPSLYI